MIIRTQKRPVGALCDPAGRAGGGPRSLRAGWDGAAGAAGAAVASENATRRAAWLPGEPALARAASPCRLLGLTELEWPCGDDGQAGGGGETGWV
jgi:hypothetical protein